MDPRSRGGQYAQWQARRTGNWLADFGVLSEVDPQDWRRGYKEKTDPQFWLENVAATAQKAGIPAKVERSLKNQYELTVQGLNARVSMKNPVKLIPVGHVMELLYSKMRAGLVPGYSSPYETYVDGIHPDNVGCYIVACTFYATIFKTSPVGLPVGDYQAGPHFHGPSTLISEELAKVIQETVWEVVASRSLSISKTRRTTRWAFRRSGGSARSFWACICPGGSAPASHFTRGSLGTPWT